MFNTPNELLSDIAAELKSRPSAWIQGAWALNEQGDNTGVNNPSAICWCLSGHISKRAPNRSPANDGARALLREANGLGPFSVTDWNDLKGRTVNEVIALCERAAAL